MSQSEGTTVTKNDLELCNSRINKVECSVSELSEKIQTVASKDSKDVIYLQLHEQYAINNNANLSTIMTLVIALIGVIGYYGYVFINTTNVFKGNLFNFYNPDKSIYYIEALILVYLASISILAILFCICTYQGISQRKEQFIIDAIRKKFLKEDDKKSIFPDNYNPYDKDRGCFEPVQGLYGELVKIFIFVFVALSFFTVFQIFFGILTSKIENILIVCFSIRITIVIVGLCVAYYYKQLESYKIRQEQYKLKQ